MRVVGIEIETSTTDFGESLWDSLTENDPYWQGLTDDQRRRFTSFAGEMESAVRKRVMSEINLSDIVKSDFEDDLKRIRPFTLNSEYKGVKVKIEVDPSQMNEDSHELFQELYHLVEEFQDVS